MQLDNGEEYELKREEYPRLQRALGRGLFQTGHVVILSRTGEPSMVCVTDLNPVRLCIGHQKALGLLSAGGVQDVAVPIFRTYSHGFFQRCEQPCAEGIEIEFRYRGRFRSLITDETGLIGVLSSPAAIVCAICIGILTSALQYTSQ